MTIWSCTLPRCRIFWAISSNHIKSRHYRVSPKICTLFIVSSIVTLQFNLFQSRSDSNHFRFQTLAHFNCCIDVQLQLFLLLLKNFSTCSNRLRLLRLVHWLVSFWNKCTLAYIRAPFHFSAQHTAYRSNPSLKFGYFSDLLSMYSTQYLF